MSAHARPLTLLLVRHGQSEWNVARRLQGQTQHVPLTELGHAQALEAARALAARGVGALISSDLLRATQTADHCARLTGLTYSTTPALREQSYGVLEGCASAVAEQVGQWGDPMWAAEGGESLTQLRLRVRGYLRGLYADPPADVVGLVTHGDTIRAALTLTEGTGAGSMPAATPLNGSVTALSLTRRPQRVHSPC